MDKLSIEERMTEELEYEHGARLGDPRRCLRHPHVHTSDAQGLFDAPCGACEAEMELYDADAEWYQRHIAKAASEGPDTAEAAETAEDDILF